MPNISECIAKPVLLDVFVARLAFVYSRTFADVALLDFSGCVAHCIALKRIEYANICIDRIIYNLINILHLD